MQDLAELSHRYRVWFCDIWGVVHDGIHPNFPTVEGLKRHRAAGGVVVLVSNSPRTSTGVARQIAEIGVDPASHDAIFTSGDVTRDLMVQEGGGKVYHLGPSRDLSIFDGLAVKRVALSEARAVVCTGLVDDLTETPDDYAGILKEIRERGLAMICANPDRLVKRGPRTLFCAGALADSYAALGGRVLMAGKPYRPIYDRAMALASKLMAGSVRANDVLAIGDGPETDMRGAANYGLAALLVADGLTEATNGLAATALEVKTAIPGLELVGAVHSLAWNGKDS